MEDTGNHKSAYTLKTDNSTVEGFKNKYNNIRVQSNVHKIILGSSQAKKGTK